MEQITKYDSYLHVLRSVGRSLQGTNPKAAMNVEAARFNVWAAIQGENWKEALAWLDALDAAIIAEFSNVSGEALELLPAARKATAALRSGLTAELDEEKEIGAEIDEANKQ